MAIVQQAATAAPFIIAIDLPPNGRSAVPLQVVIGVLSLSLNLLHDCRLDREEFARSATAINYTSLSLVFTITTVNVLISAFDVRPVPGRDSEVQILPPP